MKVATGIWRFSGILFYIIVCLFIVYTKFPRASREEQGRLIQIHSRKILEIAGLQYSWEGQLDEKLRQTGFNTTKGITLVSNHISWIDIFSLNSVIPCRFIAKADIAHWPFFGLIAKQIGTLFIDRGRRSVIVKINQEITKALDSQQTVAVFAEGTTTQGNELLPIRSNLFSPAVSLNTLIQPVIITYSSNDQPTTRMAFSGDTSLVRSLWNVVTAEKGKVTIHVLEPINPDGMDRRAIGKLCEERMKEKLQQIWGNNFKETDSEATDLLKKVISQK